MNTGKINEKAPREAGELGTSPAEAIHAGGAKKLPADTVAHAAGGGNAAAARTTALTDEHVATLKLLLDEPTVTLTEKAALSALLAAPRAEVPPGWKLVPIEPTEDMIVDGFESWPDPGFSAPDVWEAFEKMSGCQQAAHKAGLCYAAMLASAPVAAQTERAATTPSDEQFRQRVTRLLLDLHAGALLSEGQCATVLDIHRIEWRKLADESAISAPKLFAWPPLPSFPESFAHVAGHAYFTTHQMQGYANAYGKAIRESMLVSEDDAHEPIGAHDLSTSNGGRGYLAEFFAKRLRRHDFGRYIADTLAADFACALASYLRDHGSAPSGTIGARERAAVRTLTFRGYTYHGGEQWKPPRGKRPLFAERASRAVSAPMPSRASEFDVNAEMDRFDDAMRATFDYAPDRNQFREVDTHPEDAHLHTRDRDRFMGWCMATQTIEAIRDRNRSYSAGVRDGRVLGAADAGGFDAARRELRNEVLFNNDSALEAGADSLDRAGANSDAAGVRAVAHELRLMALSVAQAITAVAEAATAARGTELPDGEGSEA